jgi:hypothetical protein
VRHKAGARPLNSGVRPHWMRLSKDQSRKRWSEVRDLWLGWDPIGVMSMPNWPRDEYDSYLGPTLRLLESSASLDEIVHYLTTIELEHMGLNETAAARMKRRSFAAQLKKWYEASWPGSTV